MNKSTQRPPNRRLLRATGAADEPKGPTRGVRLPESLDSLVEGRTTPKVTRAAVIVDLIRKGLRYERLREANGDPALGELVALTDELLAARLTEAKTEIYRHVSGEYLTLRKLVEEVLNDARVSSRAAERLLTGRLLTPPQGAPGSALEEFLSECQDEAATVVDAILEECQNKVARALGRRPEPDAGPSLGQQTAAGQPTAPPDAAAR
jgi:hypothetical protein